MNTIERERLRYESLAESVIDQARICGSPVAVFLGQNNFLMLPVGRFKERIDKMAECMRERFAGTYNADADVEEIAGDLRFVETGA